MAPAITGTKEGRCHLGNRTDYSKIGRATVNVGKDESIRRLQSHTMNILKSFLSSVICLAILGGIHASASDAKTVKISAYDTMKYSVTKIEASPGEKITVTLKNEGSLPKAAMAHNWVLLNAGTDPNAYARLAVNAASNNYQPNSLSSRVIATIPLLGPGESASVTFTAPTAPGSYPYLCSFPAHCSAGMKGVLIVR